MRRRVVLLEDDPGARALLKRMLSLSNYEVYAFDEPHQCPLYVSENCDCPQEHACGDFLITDNQMPRMSGLEFIQRQISRGCKGISRNKAVLSGSWTAENQALARELGCRLFTKPVNFAEILDWLQERSAACSLPEPVCQPDSGA